MGSPLARAPAPGRADAATMDDVTHDEPTPPPASPPRKLTQREQLVTYFGFAEEPAGRAPLTEDERAEVRSRRIAGVIVMGLMVGVLWAIVGMIPALVVAVVGTIWFASALYAYGRK